MQLLRKRDSVSVPGRSTRPGTAGLPADVVADSADRLVLLAATYAAVYFIVAFVLPIPPDWTGPTRLFAAVFISISIGLVVAVRGGFVASERMQVAGFGFELVGAVGIEIGLLFWTGDPGQIQHQGPSWTGVWIIAFPLFVPAPPRTTLVVAFLAASLRPAFLAVLAARGVPMPDPSVLVQFTVPTYICVGIAVLAAKVMYGLGRDVGRARQMGSYHLLEKLGEGGMGEVWTAEHRLLARPAAIKLIRPERIAGENAAVHVQRFEREVRATARLRSPHTIEVYDFGIASDGTFYYVMELLDGLDLDAFVRTYGPMPAGRVVYVLRQACHSLAEAHERGLVHRDIKPANIFLCRSGRDVDVVKVLDFGLVKGHQASSDGDQMLTQAGSFYGTPAFAPPEMARGEMSQVDARSDLYALGCVAFWLLTGRPLFTADHPMGLLVKHNAEPPEPPSRYADGSVPETLDAVILDCLAKTQDDRPPSADDLDARLAAVQREAPWPVASARAWWSEHRPPTPDAPEAAAAPGARHRVFEPAARSAP